MGRSYFWQDPPIFSQAKKKTNFAMGPTSTFCFVTLTLRNQPVEIGEIIKDMYISVKHVLVLGTLSNFYSGQIHQFWPTFSTRFGISGLLFHNLEECGKSEA